MRCILGVISCWLFLVHAGAQEPKLVLPIGHTAAIKSVAISPDASKMVTGSEDHTAKPWDIPTLKLPVSFTKHSQAVTSAIFNHDGTRIATCSDDNKIKIWDAQTGLLLYNLANGTDLPAI